MPVRVRKLIGLIIFLLVLLAYITIAVQVVVIMPTDTNMILQVVVYTFAGILWVIPAGLIISWMSRQK